MHLLAISPGMGFDNARWRAVLASGIDALMIREKHLEAGPLLKLVRRVQVLAPELTIWVNGRLDVALAAGCGLHAPEAYPEIPQGLVSLSRPLHSPADFAARRQAQQLLLSPGFVPPGKGPALGVQDVHRWLDAFPAFQGRFLALGGITPENAASVRHARLAGVAVIRSLWDAPDPRAIVGQLREAWAD